MNVKRSWSFFLIMLLICLCAILLLAEGPIRGDIRTLADRPEPGKWQTIGAGGKLCAAAGWQDGELILRYFTAEGKSLSRQTVPLPEELEGGKVARLLPLREGQAYLGIYGTNAETLYVYRIGGSGEPERLLSVPCPGGSSLERTSVTVLSELFYEDGILSFAVRSGHGIDRYLCRDTGGLESMGKTDCGGLLPLTTVSQANGTLILGGTGWVTVNGKRTDTFAGQGVTQLTYGRGGWYYLDADTLEVCFTDAAFGVPQRLFTLDTRWKGRERSLDAVALTREESALMLLDGRILTLTDAGGTRELKGILDQTPFRAWMDLGIYALIALAAAALLWLLFCGLRKGYSSLVIFRGSVFIALALICFTVLHFVYLVPGQENAVRRQLEAETLGALSMTEAEDRMEDETLPYSLCRMLEGANHRVRVVLAEYRDEAWRTADGRLALTWEGFFPALLHREEPVPAEGETEAQVPAAEADTEEEAEPVPTAAETVSALENGLFCLIWRYGDRCLSITMEAPEREGGLDLSDTLLIAFAILAGVVLLILFSLGTDIRMISKKMESISRGGVPERLELNSGDELESMASMVNSLGDSLRKQEEDREDLEHSYRRFVPERVLALLGKQSIREVDKSAFAARRMAVMTVWFTFPDTLYTDLQNSRLLFDSVNEVIERTAAIVARKGGTVFHYAYDGFDVVMEESSEAVSTAVAIQQEVLSFNEQRLQENLPKVTLRIALDKGNVMLGIVGDTAQMEPTTISSSLSTARELIDLGNRLGAGILCTEAIITEGQENGSRYIGKCLVGDRSVRIYEVFDGDEFPVRRGKAASVREFTQGVYDLYSGSAADAKRTFLQLAHNYPQDGGIRYYLYLADRLEHDPSLPCILNGDRAGGEER